MGMIFVALVYLPRILLMLIWAILVMFYPIFLGIGIFLVIRFIRQVINRHKYYDYCKAHGISPADDNTNFVEMDREDIKDRRNV